MNEVFCKIKEFVIEKNLIDADEISEETEIENDLGITGDDAVEFLEEFSQKFKVDTSGFDFESYFMTEGINLSSIFKLFSSKKKKRKRLTLKDLQQAVERGKLI